MKINVNIIIFFLLLSHIIMGQKINDVSKKQADYKMIKDSVKEVIDAVAEDGIALVRAQQAAVDSILAASLQRARQFDIEFRIHGKVMNKERCTVPVPYDEDTATLSGIARQMEERYVSLAGNQECNSRT